MSIGLNLKLIKDLTNYSLENGLDLVTAAEINTLHGELELLLFEKMSEMEKEIISLQEHIVSSGELLAKYSEFQIRLLEKMSEMEK